MKEKLIWFEISIKEQTKFESLLTIFKQYAKGVEKKIGVNAIHLPRKSHAYDHSRVFISIVENDVEVFEGFLDELPTIKRLPGNPDMDIDMNSPVTSDINAKDGDDGSAVFLK